MDIIPQLYHNGAMKQNSASKEAKSAGLKGGVSEMARICNRSRTTLGRWYKNNYPLFEVVLIGCVSKKGES